MHIRGAQDDRLIAKTPFDAAKLPKAETRDDIGPLVLTVAHVGARAAWLDIAHPNGLLVRFAACMGLRAAEITGLRTRAVDLHEGLVIVRQTLQRIAGEWVTGTPKSKRSPRAAPVLDRLLLADLCAPVFEHPRWGSGDALVGPGRRPGSHRVYWNHALDDASFRRSNFRYKLADLVLPNIGFHRLRRTFTVFGQVPGSGVARAFVMR